MLSEHIMSNNDIKYLIKFTSKEKYANNLLDGELFMRAAVYYHELEQKKGAGQGDVREGIIYPNIAMYKNAYLPIFCLYSVRQNDISNGKTLISQRVVDDFGCENGFVVLIDYTRFVASLNKCNRMGYELQCGPVVYGYPKEDLSQKMMAEKNLDNLFIKCPFFQHQKEFRVVIWHNIEIPNNDWNTDLLYRKYHIPDGIADFSKMFYIPSLNRERDDYILPLYI